MTDGEDKNEQQPNARYTVTIEGPGVRVEQTVPKGLLPQLMAMLMNADVLPISAPPTLSHQIGRSAPLAPQPAHPRISLIEFLEDINARRIPERILGMAHYITEITAQTPNGTFTKADIQPCFKLAGDPMPANFARDWRLVVSAGWIANDAGSQDVFFVTRRGKAAIAEKFSGEGDRVTRIRRRRRVGGVIVSDPAPSDEENAS